MKLIANWRAQLNHLWSVRFAAIGLLISAADQILTAFQMFIPSWIYGVCMGLVIVARLVQQRDANQPTSQ